MDSPNTRQEQIIDQLNEELARLSLELNQKNRELQIEEALEKVRVRAMRMRESFELAESSAVMFQQLNELNINALRTAVGIFEDANDAMELWLTTYSDSDEVLRIFDYVNLHIHPVYENIIPARKQNKPYALTILEGEEVRRYYLMMSTYFKFPEQKQYNPKEYFYSFFFQEGSINVVCEQLLSEEECSIMARFAQVFGLIYTRFLDLQNAEARAKDINRQASLEKVRAEIASMRSMGDLQKITPLVWTELKKLGVLFSRCGIFIINEAEKNIHVYLSSPEGEPLAVLTLPWDSNPLLTAIVDHWRRSSVYQVHWGKEEFQNWTKLVVDHGQSPDANTYQDATHPPDELDLHFTPFTRGMLYIGNAYPLGDEEIGIALSLSDTFSIAYARYEDFIQLEKAKENIEYTLTELKSAQSQLVQAEKMASLGELTAGIAHEIQNPLNFVNNFSELNEELVQELLGEMEKGDLEEAKNIANSIGENEKKISHHGKRADAIVKSMLQHSRSTMGKIEPTDINALAEEYLRLAYHGLRAKDKSFQAKFEIELDESLGKINIIPQDIGRVILNLVNNAFYAVTAKKRDSLDGYEPLVSLKTMRSGNNILIRISDNGDGIPKQVLDKIFQPFFTTKPTGEGTGLGLSLSYDIITKGHGGQITVETNEGKGTSFLIALPQNG